MAYKDSIFEFLVFPRCVLPALIALEAHHYIEKQPLVSNNSPV